MKRCPNCGGAGEIEDRPHIAASPDDRRIECPTCFGDGDVEDTFRYSRPKAHRQELSRAHTRKYDR